MQKGIKTSDIDRKGKHEEIFPPHSHRKDIEKLGGKKNFKIVDPSWGSKYV